ncbi:MAG: hypothetical protein U9R53_10110 [Chloroflexota bacterium]|nr:hypothetical protein [Chloroflexota bacterium]
MFLLNPGHPAATAYKVRGLSTSVFIDSEGSILTTHIGEMNEMQLSAYLREIGVFE